MRAHLLATPVAVALLAPMPAQAQDATWLFTPSTALYSDPNNWTPATVPTGTAFFGPTTVPALTVTGGTTVVGGWTFNAGAPAYTFAVGPGALAFNGAGIVINAGSATIINQNFGAVTFNGASTAGSATINNQTGIVNFIGTSTAGSASIINQGNLVFLNDATAGNATITNSLFVGFEGQSTAGNATVHTIGGAVQFLQNASGGLARFITDAGGTFNITTAGPIGARGSSHGRLHRGKRPLFSRRQPAHDWRQQSLHHRERFDPRPRRVIGEERSVRLDLRSFNCPAAAINRSHHLDTIPSACGDRLGRGKGARRSDLLRLF